MKTLLLATSVLGVVFAITQGCGTSASRSSGFDESSEDSGVADEAGSIFGDDDFGNEGGTTIDPGTSDPKTCAEAATAKTYVGCDYWPTVTPNPVWSIFDFAVIVANGGKDDAEVTVTGPSGTNETVTVAANSLQKIYLPWVKSLKGGDANVLGQNTSTYDSRVVTGGAFHLVSSIPVTVYQFNALEYAGKGGKPGKSWTSCPGLLTGCFSYSNDASILLPSTAMTGTYRLTGYKGSTGSPSFTAITGTADDTSVTVKLSANGAIVAGSGVTAQAGGGTVNVTINAGDVLLLTTKTGADADMSGSLVTANKPIQALTGVPCTEIPEGKIACDHVEESVMPAETLGKHYVVARPSGPLSSAVGHLVRLYGNVDGTKLTYLPSAPSGCPTTLNAGQVADCGIVNSDFEVTGDHEFAVNTFMQGGSVVDPGSDPAKGDPAQSAAVAVEQFRMNYVFLAPDDYDVNYADIVAPTGTTLTVDGTKISTKPTVVSPGFGVVRVKLGAGNGGSHTLEADKRVGIQVLGYGSYTSYQYPAGLNLDRIATAPVN